MIRARTFVMAIIVSTGLAAATAGCHKKPPPAPNPAPPAPPPAATPAPPPPPPPPPPAAAPAPRPLTEEEIHARKSLEELTGELDDAYFDLDKSEIREDAKPHLQKDADWLKKWTTSQVQVEGHCDARGSAEYNLALGTRRASAVKDYLVNLGVPAGRVAVISKGKEAPVCSENNESCWQQNRRGHFVVTAK